MEASLVIPTFGRPAALAETLRALARIEHPRNQWEVIVVDDGSDDDVLPAVRELVRRAGAPVRLLERPHRGPAAARNAGARAAEGDILIFLDADIVVEPDFVIRHLQTGRAHSGSWVIGRIVHPIEARQTPLGRYRDTLWEAFHRAQGGDGVLDTNGMTAANLSLPAWDFAKLGGFDEDFTIASSEDWDLAMRARGAGVRILYDPNIVVIHNDWAVDLDRFCSRQRLYSVSDVLLWRKYGAGSPRAALVRENSPVRWGDDPMRLVAKKTAKRLLATRAGRAALRSFCAFAERAVPDSSCSRRAYDLAVGVAIFGGVREGLRRYPYGALQDRRSPHEGLR